MNDDVKRHQKSDLVQMQSLPLNAKIIMTKQRIKVWYESWCKFKITNTKTGKTRFVVFDTRGDKEPPLGKNEYSEYVDDGQVYVSFSGGKDSTVLLHLVRQMYPDVEAVFVNTGLEYPEIQTFVKTFDNVTILRPAVRFDEVIKTYGYPMISKDVSRKIQYAQKGTEWAKKYVEGTATMQSGEKSLYCIEKYKPLLYVDFRISSECCEVMKKKPLEEYTKQTQKKPLTAQMASESRRRLAHWLHRGCNAFDAKKPMSNPMSFWTDQDVLLYIKKYNLPIASVYGDVVCCKNSEQMQFAGFCDAGDLKTTGCHRTGCIFCGFGCHNEKGKSRFEQLKETHPKQYNYCINGGEYNEEGLWIPNNKGLGMGHVFDVINSIYGDKFIKY